MIEPWAAYRARAGDLYARHPNAMLERYLGILRFQQELASDFRPGSEGSLFRRLEPAALAGSLERTGQSVDAQTLWDYLLSGGSETEYPRDFMPRVALQAFATMSRRAAHRTIETAAGCCPHCGFPVLLLAHRPEGDGRRRFAVCSLCSAEWPAPRLDCIHCAEQRPERLPIFTFEQWPHILIQACENCRGFLKIVDLAADGNAIPIVDDIASPEVALWAAEQGYRAAAFNLLGI
jgi:FdhE protein